VPIVVFIVLYALAVGLLMVVLGAKNATVSPSVRGMEDAEQMVAVGRRVSAQRVERDPFVTLS
jgi:flagellar basal body-associated protein FliL